MLTLPALRTGSVVLLFEGLKLLPEEHGNE
jgi:hypothetical protein